MDKAVLDSDAVAFIRRFGSSLNGHVHFHVCVVDGLFEAVVGGHWTSVKRVFMVVCKRCVADRQLENLIQKIE